MASSEVSQGRREIELDFLRGIAILAVVDFHAPVQILTYPFALAGLRSAGTVGVNVFFVLSGFLVGSLLVKEWRTRGSIDSKRFLIRRGFKIWPQFYLFLLINLLTGHRSFTAVWPALLNIQNYITRGSGNSAHLWSLAVEEHAYLLLTFLLAVASRLHWRLRTVFQQLAAVCLGVVALRVILVTHGFPIFAPTHTRIAAIFYGVILAMLFHCAPDTFRTMQKPRWLWATALLTAFLFLRFHPSAPWVESVKIDVSDLIGVSAFMLVYRHRPVGNRPARPRPWPYRLVAWIGLYSYGIYLWSVSVVDFTIKLAAHMPRPVALPFLALAPQLFGIALGILMTQFVEFPMLRLRDHLFPRRIPSATNDTPQEAHALASPTLLRPL